MKADFDTLHYYVDVPVYGDHEGSLSWMMPNVQKGERLLYIEEIKDDAGNVVKEIRHTEDGWWVIVHVSACEYTS